MNKKVVVIAIVVVVLLGARAALEHQASQVLEKAQQLYEDGKYRSALQKLDSLNTFYVWTSAAKQGRELRDTIEDKIERQTEDTMREMANQERQRRQDEIERKKQEQQGY